MNGTLRSANALVFAFLVAASATAQAPLRPDPAVLASFDGLVSFIAAVPADQLNKGQKTSFTQRLDNARRAYESGQICTAANVLGAELNEAQAARRGTAVAAAEELYDRARRLRDAIVSVAAPTAPCADPSIGRPPAVNVLGSDNQHFAARVTFGAPLVWSVRAGGETWTQMSLPAIDNLIGAPGFPAVPSWQSLIAVPRGATIRVASVQPVVRESVLLNLYPHQKQAADSESSPFLDPPFVKNTTAYQTNAFTPATPCAARFLGEIRDVRIAQIECNAAQYNPVSDQMVLFDSVAFDVRFDGGDGTFATTQTVSPFEPASSAAVGSVLNGDVVKSNLLTLGDTYACEGEELLILTHPSMRQSADNLAAWKQTKGIITSVFEVGQGTNIATGDQIDALIESRYDTCRVRPSYVLLIGDAELVPPARRDYDTTGMCDNCGDPTTGSDWGYATYSKTFFAFLPWFGVARIPADLAYQADIVVNKTIQYESHPPFLGILRGAPFYTTAMNASYFQCCRTDVSDAGRDMRKYIETSERVRNALVASGYAVQRIYTTSTDMASAPVSDPTPRSFFDGTPLPSALAPGTFSWTGSTQDVIDAFNQGRFLVLHRDHGNSDQWGFPSFSGFDLGSLTNGPLLPFLYSINCATAFWDQETDGTGPFESFMERILVQDGGGIVAGLGDNRNSPTDPNNALTRGFFDATWPNVAPEFGFNESDRRLADILDHGKVYMLTQIGVSQPNEEVNLTQALGEEILWHAFGDPTAEMWTANPYGIVLPGNFTLEVSADQTQITVQYPVEGATLTAFQPVDGGVIAVARGTVHNGVATIPVFAKPDPQQQIMLSASLPNAVSVLLTQSEVIP